MAPSYSYEQDDAMTDPVALRALCEQHKKCRPYPCPTLAEAVQNRLPGP